VHKVRKFKARDRFNPAFLANIECRRVSCTKAAKQMYATVGFSSQSGSNPYDLITNTCDFMTKF